MKAFFILLFKQKNTYWRRAKVTSHTGFNEEIICIYFDSGLDRPNIGKVC